MATDEKLYHILIWNGREIESHIIQELYSFFWDSFGWPYNIDDMPF